MEAHWVETEDWHTAGEPFRIVENLPSHCTIEGASVREKYKHILSVPSHPADLLRQSLCHEPRGHADMYGGFIVPGDDARAHFGVLFWHRDGFSTACGHGTIALGRWAVSKGIVPATSEGSVDVVIDVPSGRVIAKVCFHDAVAVHVDFINIASYQIASRVPIEIRHASRSYQLYVDVSFGGAVFASVDVKHLEMSVERKNHAVFIDVGRQIKKGLYTNAKLVDYDLFGIIFFETLDDNARAITQKNVNVFADGQIDRSPCGSGTSARMAVLLAQGRVSGEKKLIHYSIIDTVFESSIVSQERNISEFPSCITKVRGNANITGRHHFYIDPKDPTYPGFSFH